MTERIAKEALYPNTTQIPNLYLDKVFHLLTDAECRALLYLSRHTYGWGRVSASISLDEFVNGRFWREGEHGERTSRRMDAGCGLRSRSAISKALEGLQEYGLVNQLRQATLGDMTGSEWQTIKDEARIDVDGLTLRAQVKQRANRKRTEAGRAKSPKQERPAPGQSDTPAPGQSDTPAPGQSDTPAPGQSDTPAPGQSDTPAPGQSDTPLYKRLNLSGKPIQETYQENLNTTTLDDLTDHPPHNTSRRRRREETGAVLDDSVSPPFPNDEEPEAEQTALSVKDSVLGMSNSWLRETYRTMKAEGYGNSWERTEADLRGWLSLPHIGQVDVEEALHLADQNGKSTRAYVGGILRRRSRDRADEARQAQELADWEARNAEQQAHGQAERRPPPADTTDDAPPANDLSAAWSQTLDALRPGMNPGQFDNFLRGSTAARGEAGCVRVTLRNPLASGWLNIQSAPRASRTLSRLLGEPVAVLFAAEPSADEEITQALREEMAVAA